MRTLKPLDRDRKLTELLKSDGDRKWGDAGRISKVPEHLGLNKVFAAFNCGESQVMRSPVTPHASDSNLDNLVKKIFSSLCPH